MKSARFHSPMIWTLALAGAIPCFGQAGTPVPHEFLFRLRDGELIQDITDDHQATVLASYPSQRLYLVLMPPQVPDDDAEVELELDDRLEDVHQNEENLSSDGQTRSFFFGVAPLDYMIQPARAQINLPLQMPTLGRGVTVAILDTGVSPHALLGTRVLTNGWNFVDHSSNTSDVGNLLDDNGNGEIDELTGHGTLIAGAVSIVAPESRILPIRVLDSDGEGTTYRIAAGIHYAIDHGARVINLSLSTPTPSPVVSAAISRALFRGIVVVGAMGSDGTSAIDYPAACAGVIAVAAVDPLDQISAFSNYGADVSICAPGVGIVGTTPDGSFGRADGTSMSAALVSGAAALLKSLDGRTPPARIRAILTATADPIDLSNPGFAGLIGSGRLNVSRALAVQVWTLQSGGVAPVNPVPLSARQRHR